MYPDALQRTIPIWCHVLNHIFCILSEDKEGEITLKMPPWILGSEREQIEDRAQREWIPKLLSSNILNELSGIQRGFDGERVRLEPFWIDRLSEFSKIQSAIRERIESEHIIPVILLTASRPFCLAVDIVPPHRRSPKHDAMRKEIDDLNFEYIQGAGDDEEHWSRGITPRTFWENKDSFLQCQSDGQCLETLRVIEDTAKLQREQKVDEEAECESVSMTEMMVALSSKQILNETKERLYALCNDMVELNRMTDGDGDILRSTDTFCPFE